MRVGENQPVGRQFYFKSAPDNLRGAKCEPSGANQVGETPDFFQICPRQLAAPQIEVFYCPHHLVGGIYLLEKY